MLPAEKRELYLHQKLSGTITDELRSNSRFSFNSKRKYKSGHLRGYAELSEKKKKKKKKKKYS